MYRLVTIKDQLPARKFSTNTGDSTAVDIVLDDGLNTFCATAFDKLALELAASPLPIGGCYAVDLSFKVNQKDGRYFQSVRCVNIRKYGI